MPRTKVAKKEILDKVTTIVGTLNEKTGSMVFVNFHGLKVADTMLVRRQLKGEKIGFFVAKKTLIRKALTEKGFTGTMPEFNGELGIAYGADLIAPAREVHTFQNKYKGSISILGGIFEGKYMSKDEMTAIALIPSQKTLQAMFVNVINSPIQGFVMAIDQIAKKKTA
ncbi:MAG: ribosomal protein large subunit ribosomal protein [Candidatus Parcubacteria bacterium]|jgi:large subunit ribosomal protein L10